MDLIDLVDLIDRVEQRQRKPTKEQPILIGVNLRYHSINNSRKPPASNPYLNRPSSNPYPERKPLTKLFNMFRLTFWAYFGPSWASHGASWGPLGARLLPLKMVREFTCFKHRCVLNIKENTSRKSSGASLRGPSCSHIVVKFIIQRASSGSCHQDIDLSRFRGEFPMVVGALGGPGERMRGEWKLTKGPSVSPRDADGQGLAS